MPLHHLAHSLKAQPDLFLTLDPAFTTAQAAKCDTLKSKLRNSICIHAFIDFTNKPS
jgi:hypothetical protein